MRRGTTPTIKLTVSGISDIEIDKIFLTIKQRSVVVEKEKSDITINDDILQVTLSQEETLQFSDGIAAEMQLRVLSINGTAYASQILEVSIGQILKDGVIK